MLLALDTSTLTLSLALVTRGAGGRLEAVEERSYGPPRKQSELLPEAVGALLSRHGVALEQLEGICLGLGPGSFTGLRVGLATAKALAYAGGLRLAGASSLAAVAIEGPEDALLVPCAVARQDELYIGLYRRRGDEVERVEPEQAVTPAALAALLASRPGAMALGPALREYRPKLEALGAPPERLLDAPAWPSALAIARLARLPESFDLQALFALEPSYIRASEAERNPRFPPLPGPPPTSRFRED